MKITLHNGSNRKKGVLRYPCNAINNMKIYKCSIHTPKSSKDHKCTPNVVSTPKCSRATIKLSNVFNNLVYIQYV